MQVTGSGTVSGNGVITTVTIPDPAATTPVTMQGALIANGSGTATNANGTDSFTFVAHCNATCSQIYVKTYDGHTGVSETGTLSK